MVWHQYPVLKSHAMALNKTSTLRLVSKSTSSVSDGSTHGAVADNGKLSCSVADPDRASGLSDEKGMQPSGTNSSKTSLPNACSRHSADHQRTCTNRLPHPTSVGQGSARETEIVPERPTDGGRAAWRKQRELAMQQLGPPRICLRLEYVTPVFLFSDQRRVLKEVSFQRSMALDRLSQAVRCVRELNSTRAVMRSLAKSCRSNKSLAIPITGVRFEHADAFYGDGMLNMMAVACGQTGLALYGRLHQKSVGSPEAVPAAEQLCHTNGRYGGGGQRGAASLSPWAQQPECGTATQDRWRHALRNSRPS
eukprot:1407623-Pleurochrysis_carterae.AAC.1